MESIATVATRPLARARAVTAPARSICDTSQPPKISPFQLAFSGMAMVCRASVPCGWGMSSLVMSCYPYKSPGNQVASSGNSARMPSIVN